jgi:hypothetical protein
MNSALHLRVDLSDGRRTFVPEGGNESADEELQCVDVAQGLDPSPEGPKANLASKGKPRIINPVVDAKSAPSAKHTASRTSWLHT